MRRFLHNNGLSLTVLALFLVFLVGASWAGTSVYNNEQHAHDAATVSWAEYVRTGHFAEAIFENWESEFFQMFAFIWLTALLYQAGSPESKRLEGDAVDEDPLTRRNDRRAPRLVRVGRPITVRLYSHSLTIAFFAMWICSVLLHAWGGQVTYNQENAAHGEPLVSLGGYFGTSQFWFESMQNYQSEFMVLIPMLVLGIWLRERGSAQSKPVHAPHAQTGSG